MNHPFWGTPIFGNTHVGSSKHQHVAPLLACNIEAVRLAAAEKALQASSKANMATMSGGGTGKTVRLQATMVFNHHLFVK